MPKNGIFHTHFVVLVAECRHFPPVNFRPDIDNCLAPNCKLSRRRTPRRCCRAFPAPSAADPRNSLQWRFAWNFCIHIADFWRRNERTGACNARPAGHNFRQVELKTKKTSLMFYDTNDLLVSKIDSLKRIF